MGRIDSRKTGPLACFAGTAFLRLAPVGAGAVLRLWGGQGWGLPLWVCLGVLSAAVAWLALGPARRDGRLWVLVCSLALMAAGYLLPGRRLLYGAAVVLHAVWRGRRLAARSQRLPRGESGILRACDEKFAPDEKMRKKAEKLCKRC